jgi:hypothetical protein
MPVYRYRSIEEMDAHTWRTPGDPALYRAIAFTWELARRTNPRHFPPGVHRFRTIEEMNRADDARLDEHVRTRREPPAIAGSEPEAKPIRQRKT